MSTESDLFCDILQEEIEKGWTEEQWKAFDKMLAKFFIVSPSRDLKIAMNILLSINFIRCFSVESEEINGELSRAVCLIYHMIENSEGDVLKKTWNTVLDKFLKGCCEDEAMTEDEFRLFIDPMVAF